MQTLYFYPGACSRASHIALREAGAEFKLQRIDFASAEQHTEAYRQVNPKGRVPALDTGRGILTETPAILLYIAQSYPDAALAPLDDPFELARLQAFNSYLCSTVHVAHAHSRRGERWADDPGAIAEMKRKAPEVMAACFQLIEDEYVVGPWVMGDRFSLADAYLFTITHWLDTHAIESLAYPKVDALMNAMLERPAVREVLAAEVG